MRKRMFVKVQVLNLFCESRLSTFLNLKIYKFGMNLATYVSKLTFETNENIRIDCLK